MELRQIGRILAVLLLLMMVIILSVMPFQEAWATLKPTSAWFAGDIYWNFETHTHRWLNINRINIVFDGDISNEINLNDFGDFRIYKNGLLLEVKVVYTRIEVLGFDEFVSTNIIFDFEQGFENDGRYSGMFRFRDRLYIISSRILGATVDLSPFLPPLPPHSGGEVVTMSNIRELSSITIDINPYICVSDFQIFIVAYENSRFIEMIGMEHFEDMSHSIASIGTHIPYYIIPKQADEIRIFLFETGTMRPLTSAFVIN